MSLCYCLAEEKQVQKTQTAAYGWKHTTQVIKKDMFFNKSSFFSYVDTWIIVHESAAINAL